MSEERRSEKSLEKQLARRYRETAERAIVSPNKIHEALSVVEIGPT
jgi:hypothetical protein